MIHEQLLDLLHAVSRRDRRVRTRYRLASCWFLFAMITVGCLGAASHTTFPARVVAWWLCAGGICCGLTIFVVSLLRQRNKIRLRTARLVERRFP